MSKLRFSTVLLLVAMLSLMAFGGVAAQDEEPEVDVTSLGSGDIKISFWNGLTGSDGVTLNEMLAQFVEENPDISITTEIVDWNTLYPKLQSAFVGGQPPDVFMLHASEILQFQSLGMLMPMTDMYDIGGGTLPAEDFSQPGFDGVFVDGVPYAVPLDNHGRGLWVNVGLLEAAGIDPNIQPASPEEWVDLFKTLTIDANGNNAHSPDFDDANIVQYGLAFDWVYVDFESLIWQFGGSIISEDGKTATVNSEAGIKAVQTMIDMIEVHKVAPAPAGFDSWQGWAAQQVAVVTSGTWFRNFAADQTDIEYAAWPLFQLGDQPAAWFGSHVFMLPSTADGVKLDAAKRMIEWVSNNQLAWAASGQVPARISVQESLDPEEYPTNIIIGQSLQEFGHMEVASTAILELQAAIDPELSAALNGQKTAEEALNDANARMQQILDRTQR